MSINNYRFKHQSKPSTRTPTIGDITVAWEPMIVDLSSTYPNNQESAISVNEYSVNAASVDILGVVGNFVITDKTLDDGTFLFYEYQPLFDVATSGFIVIDKDGFLLPHKTQYGFIEEYPTTTNKHSKLLNTNVCIDYDPLNGHSELGIPIGSVTFSSPSTPSGYLPYSTHADSLSYGKLAFREFDGSILPNSGCLDFAFYSSNLSSYNPILEADDWSINVGSGNVGLTVNGVNSSSININDNSWYRARFFFGDVCRIEVYQDTLIGQEQINDSIESSGFVADCEYKYLNNLTLYDTPPTYDWNTPSILPRYNQTIRWQDYPVETEPPYRIRILTEESIESSIIYDAQYPNGSVYQNKKEPMNLIPIYRESITETQSWSQSGSNLLLTGPIASASSIYLQPIFEGFISVNIVDNQIVVTDGEFKSSIYDTTTGKYQYMLLEYDNLMPFAIDNQNYVLPYSLKESKYKATVIDAYKIKVLPMEVFEGRYPNYNVPITEDITKLVSSNTVTSVTGTITNNTWRKTRGMRIYVNGTQLDQTAIRSLDFNLGIIELNTPVKPDNNVEVTFLRKAQYFVCDYPRLKPGLVNGTSWRIYLRPYWPNYFLDNPSDDLERLCYKELRYGQPTGSLKSCVSNEIVSEIDGTIHLADISLFPVVNFEDARIFGGGIISDNNFESTSDRIDSVRSSIFYSDISKFQSTLPSNLSSVIPSPSIFVKIPNAIKTSIENRFNSEDTALAYIKSTIEKHLALGTYYIIIDENNKPWDKPFPQMTNLKKEPELES